MIADYSSTPALADDAYEVVFTACAKVDDGRYNNNGWLQEIPDPITKVTWDNCRAISPATAKKLGIAEPASTTVIEISLEKRSLEIPVIIAPGHADGSISIALGYGRSVVGRVGKGTGFNAYPLRTTGQPYFATGAKVRVTGKSYKLALTQEHGALEGRGGDITREATVDEYKAKPDFAKTMGMDAHIPPNVSLYSNPPLNDIHQWGMVVDLNTCIGCSACMVACQAENNIPIVGKEQVINGREMHWIRTDRYFASTDENDPDPEMISQPMMCQHCENAPCETVCPVNATVHSEDGLNVMAYNRCIGTRYCANNCPFKVRRFNFFDYNQRKIEDGGLYKWNLIAPKGTEDTIKLSEEPERHRAHARRHGEMHLLRAAHPGSEDRREGRGARFGQCAHPGGFASPAPARRPARRTRSPSATSATPRAPSPSCKASERGYRLLRVSQHQDARLLSRAHPQSQPEDARRGKNRRSDEDPTTATARKPRRNPEAPRVMAESAAHSRNAAGTPARPAGRERPSAQLDHRQGLRHRRSADAVLVVAGLPALRGHRARRAVLHRLPDLERRRRLGRKQAGRLGVGHHELRVLDRYRPRRHAHLGDPFPHAAEVAHLDQSRRGSDDALRGHLRGHFPRHPRRSRLDGVVPRADPECQRHLAELPFAAALGRVRGLDLFHGLACSSGTPASCPISPRCATARSRG